MSKIHEKIMQTDFAKNLKKLVIIMVCTALVGGGLSAVMLRPQIREAADSARRWEQDGEKRYSSEDGDSDRQDDDGDRRDDEEHRNGDSDRRDGREEHVRGEDDFFDHMAITKPSAGTLITVGITGLLMSVFMILFWLFVAAWLYQAAVLSDMDGLLWLIAGLIGNVFAAVIFLIFRNFTRIKCPSCGHFQQVKTQFCAKCGSALHKICVNCGASCGADDEFCHTCGKKLHEKEQ